MCSNTINSSAATCPDCGAFCTLAGAANATRSFSSKPLSVTNKQAEAALQAQVHALDTRNDTDYELEAIVGSKQCADGTWFKLKWLGHPSSHEPLWVPESVCFDDDGACMCSEIMEKWSSSQSSHKKCSRK